MHIRRLVHQSIVAGKANVVIQLRLIVMVELVILSEFLNELLIELFILCLATRHVVSHFVKVLSKSLIVISVSNYLLRFALVLITIVLLSFFRY